MVESWCAITSVVRPLHNSVERFLHLPLGFRTQRRRRLVEQDDRRVLNQRACNGDALALATGKLQAMLADRRVVAEREACDEIVRVRRLGGGHDLGFAGAEAAERDIVADAAAVFLSLFYIISFLT